MLAHHLLTLADWVSLWKIFPLWLNSHNFLLFCEKLYFILLFRSDCIWSPVCEALSSKGDKHIVIHFSANYLTFSFSSLAAIQHERGKYKKWKIQGQADRASVQGGQRRGHQGQGLIQTELQADRLNPPLLSSSKEFIKLTKRSECKRKYEIGKLISSINCGYLTNVKILKC